MIARYAERRCRLTGKTPFRVSCVAWLAVGLFVPLSGCARPTRPDPSDTFLEICQRSLDDDAEYIRARIAPSFADPATGQAVDRDSDEFIRGLMREFRMCRPAAFKKTDDPDKVVVEVAGTKQGRVRCYDVSLIYDEEHGWQLASRLTNERPLPPKQ